MGAYSHGGFSLPYIAVCFKSIRRIAADIDSNDNEVFSAEERLLYPLDVYRIPASGYVRTSIFVEDKEKVGVKPFCWK